MCHSRLPWHLIFNHYLDSQTLLRMYIVFEIEDHHTLLHIRFAYVAFKMKHMITKIPLAWGSFVKRRVSALTALTDSLQFSDRHITIIMGDMASQSTGVSTVYLTLCSDAHQRIYQSSAAQAFVTVTGEFPSQRAGDTEVFSISWRHHGSLCRDPTNITRDTLLAKKVVTPRDDVSFLWLFLFHQSARSKDRLFGVI